MAKAGSCDWCGKYDRDIRTVRDIGMEVCRRHYCKSRVFGHPKCSKWLTDKKRGSVISPWDTRDARWREADRHYLKVRQAAYANFSRRVDEIVFREAEGKKRWASDWVVGVFAGFAPIQKQWLFKRMLLYLAWLMSPDPAPRGHHKSLAHVEASIVAALLHRAHCKDKVRPVWSKVKLSAIFSRMRVVIGDLWPLLGPPATLVAKKVAEKRGYRRRRVVTEEEGPPFHHCWRYRGWRRPDGVWGRRIFKAEQRFRHDG